MEITLLQRQLKTLEEGQSVIQRQNEIINHQVGKLDDEMRTITQAIKGNVDIGIMGLAKRVETLENFSRRQEKIYQKILGAGTVVGILWTLLMKFWDKLFGI